MFSFHFSFVFFFYFFLAGCFFSSYAQEPSFQSHKDSFTILSEEDSSLSKDLDILLNENASSQTSDINNINFSLVKNQKATISLLDKITGHIKNLSVSLNTPYTFGRLTFTVFSCYQNVPEEAPESISFMEIKEIDPLTKMQQLLFRNWMYASSPSISALDHPIYDIWLKGCE